jgi:hypothetical protein
MAPPIGVRSPLGASAIAISRRFASSFEHSRSVDLVLEFHALQRLVNSLCDKLVGETVGVRIGRGDPEFRRLLSLQISQNIDKWHAELVGSLMYEVCNSLEAIS